MTTLDEASTLDDEMERIRQRSAALPWYRRPRRLRRQVAGTLVVTALVAIALFGGLSYYASDRLLREGATDQLNSVAKTRAVRIEDGANRVLSQVATIAADLGVVEALVDLGQTFEELDESISPDQQAALDEFYRTEVVDPLNASGLAEITVDDVEPTSDAARWVQYHHVLPTVDATTDETAYGRAMAEHDPFLRSLAASLDLDDLLLIAGSSDDDVVYTAAKRIDLGGSLSDGALADSVVARLVRDQLDRVRAGRGVLSNYEIYLPNQARPTLFAAAAVRDGTEIVGAVAVELPAAALDAITTAGYEWDRMGLEGGESYVVSSDLVLQSASRPWIEDPEAYLDAVDDPELRAIIETLGSPVGVQIVDTAPVRAAFNGEEFEGRTTNYLGQSTYSSSTAIDIQGGDWVVVTDIPVDRARGPVDDFTRRMLLVALVVIPLAAVVGVLIARRLSRPIGPAVSAARTVAEGERRFESPSTANDEFGDLGRRLARMATALERQEQALSDEFDRKRQMMLAVLPPQMLRDDGAIVDDGDVVDVATAISIAIDTDALHLDTDELAEMLHRWSELVAALVDRHALQRIRVAADRGLYVAGAGSDDTGAETAIAFVRAVRAEVARLAEASDPTGTIHIGVSTGAIATGVLTDGSLTFAAFGEPVRRALAISALSAHGQVLVDATTRDELTDRSGLVAVDGIVDLDGERMDVYALDADGDPTA